MKIFLARHGQSIFNAQYRFSGQGNTRLTKLGKQQAESIANFFSKKNIQAIFFSDLSRASVTAHIVAKKISPKPKLFKEKGLREGKFGDWEGKKPSELTGKNALLEKKWRKNHFRTRPQKGESFSDLEKRLKLVLKKILSFKFKNFLIVSHSGTTIILLKLILGWRQKKALETIVENTSIFEITITGSKRKFRKIIC
ncbi:MAG: histidine phosphatase family protein [Candidatus ainarchaeum sp.]|nr:histidine phosphatase family protein [Candidatus ainarchaeum sp.]